MSMNIKLMDPEVEDRELSLSLPVDFQMSGSHYNDLARYLGQADGIGWLEGKKAADCIDRLWSAFQKAAAETPDEDWRYSTGFFLMLLWSHARSNPQGVFSTCY